MFRHTLTCVTCSRTEFIFLSAGSEIALLGKLFMTSEPRLNMELISECNSLQAAPGRVSRGAGPAREAIVFMIGGGNYIEYDSLQAWAHRSQPPRSIVYGSTDLPTGESFVRQLADLGRSTPG